MNEKLELNQFLTIELCTYSLRFRYVYNDFLLMKTLIWDLRFWKVTWIWETSFTFCLLDINLDSNDFFYYSMFSRLFFLNLYSTTAEQQTFLAQKFKSRAKSRKNLWNQRTIHFFQFDVEATSWKVKYGKLLIFFHLISIKTMFGSIFYELDVKFDKFCNYLMFFQQLKPVIRRYLSLMTLNLEYVCESSNFIHGYKQMIQI